MTSLDWFLSIGAVVLMFAQGWWVARAQRTTEDYFVGGRRMNWLAVGLSMFATTFSPLSFVGLPREAAFVNYHLFLAILFIPLFVAPIVGWLFVPLYQRLQLTSAYEYLERRFDWRLRRCGSLLFAFYTLGWMGSMLFATGLIVQAALGLSDAARGMAVIILGAVTTTYTTIGGFKAAVWTNVLKSAVLAGVIVAVLVLAIARIDGGLISVWNLGREQDKFAMFNLKFDLTSRATFPSACAFGMFVYFAAAVTSQSAVQRYVSMPNVAAGRRSLVVNGVGTALVCLLFFVLGSVMFAFYSQHPANPRGDDTPTLARRASEGVNETSEPSLARRASVTNDVFPKLARQDQLTIHFVRTELPYPGLIGLLLAGLFTTVMGSVSSGLSALSALIMCDWLPGRTLSVSRSRFMSALFGIATIGTSLLVPYLGEHVFDIIIRISGAFFGPLLGLFLLGACVPRANSGGASLGLAAGLISLGVIFPTQVSPWWYGALTCLPTLVVGMLGSFLFPPPTRERIRGLLVAPLERRESGGTLTRSASEGASTSTFRPGPRCSAIRPRLRFGLVCWIATLLTLTAPARAEPPTPNRDVFRFTDVTAEVGLKSALHGAFNHAIAWGDFDNDGRVDLFLGNFADRGSAAQYGLTKPKANQLFRQVAGGKFEPFPCPAVEVAMRCSGAVFVDLDNDGDLDLYVTSNRQVNPKGEPWQQAVRLEGCRLYRNDGYGRFVDVSANSGACPADFFRCRDIGVFDVDGDGLLDLFVMQDKGITPDDVIIGLKLFRNLGGFQFEDVARQIGLPNDLWGTGIAVADLNGDRRPDFYLCGSNRLFVSTVGWPPTADPSISTPGRPRAANLPTYHEPEAARKTFAQPEGELDWVTGAAFGDLDGDGDFDLITGRHHYHGPSRVHVYLNEAQGASGPRFREITSDFGLSALPQKAPHPEIQDFDNDGLVDLYWSADVVDGITRRPFICRGLGVRGGLPRFAIPSVPEFSDDVLKQNVPPPDRAAMIYHVNGPALDYDGDGDLDLLACNWPPGGSHFLRNDTPAGHWLQVRVVGRHMNRQGIGTQVRVFTVPRPGIPRRLLAMQEITLNGGYSSSRPAQAHFGLGEITECELEVAFPTRPEPCLCRNVRTNQILLVTEP